MPDYVDISRDENVVRDFSSTYNSKNIPNTYSVTESEKSAVTQNLTHPEDITGINGGPQTNYSAVSKMWDDITKNNRAAYKAFGLPPQFNKYADPEYLEDLNIKIGRVYSSTYMVNPTIISLKPCGVKYNMVGSTKTANDEFFSNALLGIAEEGGDTNIIETIKTSLFNDEDPSGVLYSTTSMVDEYLRAVNYSLRLLSVYMGIHNKVVPGATNSEHTTYGEYNWMNYQATRFASNGFTDHVNGYGNKPLNSFVNAAIDIFWDENITAHEDWFHFYCDTGTSVDESISVSVTSSMIENALNEGSLNELARNLNFLTGGKVNGADINGMDGDTDQMMADINQVIEETRSTAGGWMAKLLKGATGYLKGARIAFPKIIEDCEYGKSLDVTCRFISPYGDKESIYLYTYVPLMHLLPFAVPGQYDGISYSFPYLCKVTIPGFFQSEIAVISNLSIKRGGDEDLQWTAENLATEITVQFTVTPLLTTLMLSQTRNFLNATKNYALMEYLSNLGGIDMSNPENKFDIRMNTWAVLLKSSWSDFTGYFGAQKMMQLKGNMPTLFKKALASFANLFSGSDKNADQYANTNNSQYTFTEFMSR